MDCVNPYRTRRFVEARAGLKDIAPAAVAAVPTGCFCHGRGAGIVARRGDADVCPRLRRRGPVRGDRELGEPGARGGACLRDAADQRPPRPHGGVAGAEDAGEPDAEASGLLFLTDDQGARGAAFLDRPVTAAYWFAMAAVLPVAWIVSTALGAVLGSVLGSPERLGADFAFTALFIGLIAVSAGAG